jgi:DNA polymerase III subunit epsilon
MIDWFKNIGKEFPEFWKEYLVQIDVPSTRKVALHIETTGINPTKDKIISIGAIAIENNQILIEKSLEIDLNKEETINSKELTYQEAQAIESLVNFIGNATLIGHRIHYDIEILNEYLSKLQSGRLKSNLLDIEVMHGRIIDTPSKKYSFEELLSYYKINNPELVTTGNYAYMIGLLFLKMKNKLGL